MERIVYVSLVLVAFVVVGCVEPTYTSKNNFTHIRTDEPVIRSFKNPEVDFKQYGRYSYLKVASVDTAHANSDIEQAQMRFILDNTLSALGYTRVPDGQDADFTVSMTYGNPRKQTYVPPQQVTVPRYVQGQTVETQADVAGCRNGQYVVGTGKSTTRLPGYWVNDTYNQPGYTQVDFYPVISIDLVSADSKTKLWSGTVSCLARTEDIRLTGQFMIAWLLWKGVPARLSDQASMTQGRGNPGFSWVHATCDGNAFFPSIVNIQVGGAAEKAGLKLYDQIVAVNGQSTENVDVRAFLRMIGAPGDSMQLTVRRLEAIQTVHLTLRDCATKGLLPAVCNPGSSQATTR